MPQCKSLLSIFPMLLAVAGPSSAQQERIAAAVAKAAEGNRRVLVEFHADDCVRCAILDDAIGDNRELAREILYEYELLQLDATTAAELARQQFGLDLDKVHTPALVVLDGKGKQLGTLTYESFFEDELTFDAKRLIEALTRFHAEPLDASALLAGALREAKATRRRVLVHFGAPW